MGYWIQSVGSPQNGESPNVKTFYADTAADINNLPTHTKEGVPQGDLSSHKQCAYGSSCLCIETSDLYVLGKETDKWIKL